MRIYPDTDYRCGHCASEMAPDIEPMVPETGDDPGRSAKPALVCANPVCPYYRRRVLFPSLEMKPLTAYNRIRVVPSPEDQPANNDESLRALVVMADRCDGLHIFVPFNFQLPKIWKEGEVPSLDHFRVKAQQAQIAELHRFMKELNKALEKMDRLNWDTYTI